MKKFTQKDLMRHSQTSFSRYAGKIIRGEMDLNEVDELLPSWIHINDGHTIALTHVGHKGLRLLEKTNEEIQTMDMPYLQSIIDEYSQVLIASTVPAFFMGDDRHDAISFFQRIRYTPGHPYKLYYTTTRIMDDQHLISFTLPVETFTSMSGSIRELVCEHGSIVNSFQRYKVLSNREKEIFKLLAAGYNLRGIGERMFISPGTVKKHKQNIYSKLGINKISELVKIAIQLGIVSA